MIINDNKILILFSRLIIMDNQPSTKMPKPFDDDDEEEVHVSTLDTNPQQFQLREDNRLKQEDDYRQGK